MSADGYGNGIGGFNGFKVVINRWLPADQVTRIGAELHAGSPGAIEKLAAAFNERYAIVQTSPPSILDLKTREIFDLDELVAAAEERREERLRRAREALP